MEEYINEQIEKLGIIGFSKVLILIGIIGFILISILAVYVYNINTKKLEELKNKPEFQTESFEDYTFRIQENN